MRKLRGLKKTQLAKKAGIHHSIIGKIESGDCQYSRNLFDISDALDVDVVWIFRRNTERKKRFIPE